MADLMVALNGKKTYIAVAVGMLAVVANHFFGPIPGVSADPANWLGDLYNLFLLATGRSALKKIE